MNAVTERNAPLLRFQFLHSKRFAIQLHTKVRICANLFVGTITVSFLFQSLLSWVVWFSPLESPLDDLSYTIHV